MSQELLPIACSLPMREAAGQVGEWHDLRPFVIGAEKIRNGLVVTYEGEVADRVEDLVARESQCCAWLQLTTTRRTDSIRLELTSENPDAGPVIEALAVGS